MLGEHFSHWRSGFGVQKRSAQHQSTHAMNFSKITLLAVVSMLALAGASRTQSYTTPLNFFIFDKDDVDFHDIAGENNMIDLEEWAAFQDACEHPYMKKLTFDEVAGEDKQISYAEWMALASFLNVGGGDDGIVSREEFMNSYNGKHMDLFTEMDKDGSGDISWTEWRDVMYPKFAEMYA